MAECSSSASLLSQVFTVTNTLDNTSMGSLRWAIGQVNSDTTDTAASPDQIDFNIPTGRPGLNELTTRASGRSGRRPPCDKSTPRRHRWLHPAGGRPGTSATGDNATIKVELFGSDRSFDGLNISGGHSVVEGLAIGGFQSTPSTSST